MNHPPHVSLVLLVLEVAHCWSISVSRFGANLLCHHYRCWQSRHQVPGYVTAGCYRGGHQVLQARHRTNVHISYIAVIQHDAALQVKWGVSINKNTSTGEGAERKRWYGKLTPRYGFVGWRRRQAAWLKIKEKTRRRGPTLVGTSKGTSHWWVCYCEVKWWLCATSFGLYPCYCG